jgi:hypothetical protein
MLLTGLTGGKDTRIKEILAFVLKLAVYNWKYYTSMCKHLIGLELHKYVYRITLDL